MSRAGGPGRRRRRAGRLAGPATIVVDDDVDRRDRRPATRRSTATSSATARDVVTAGLIDLHTHGAVGVQAIDGDVDGLRGSAPFYARHGVTGFLATIGGSDDASISVRPRRRATLMRRCRHARRGALPRRPPRGSVHQPVLPGRVRPRLDRGARPRHVRAVPRARRRHGAHDHARARARRPARRDRRRSPARGHRLGGHSAATDAEFVEAIELGVSAVTHLFNAMPPLHHRAPGIVGVALTDDAARRRADRRRRPRPPHGAGDPRACAQAAATRIALITDSIAATGLADGEYALRGAAMIVVRWRGPARRRHARRQHAHPRPGGRQLRRVRRPRVGPGGGVGDDDPGPPARARRSHRHDRRRPRRRPRRIHADGDVRWTLVGGRLVFGADQA